MITVQEPVKEPEPEKKRNKRLDTLVLNQSSALSRSTVGWATPGEFTFIDYIRPKGVFDMKTLSAICNIKAIQITP